MYVAYPRFIVDLLQPRKTFPPHSNRFNRSAFLSGISGMDECHWLLPKKEKSNGSTLASLPSIKPSFSCCYVTACVMISRIIAGSGGSATIHGHCQRSYQLFASEPIGFSAQARVFSHIVHVHTMAVLPIEIDIDIVQLLGDLTDFDSF